MATVIATSVLAGVLAYLAGSIPWAYIITKHATGKDITRSGSGNVGAMNVRRITGSWGWFVVTVIADMSKGFIPVAVTRLVLSRAPLCLPSGGLPFLELLPIQAAVAGAVLGHSYSLYLAIMRAVFTRTGKGLATGAGALLAYDWRYLIAVVGAACLVILVTRYRLAGQVAAAVALPVASWVLDSPDWPFAVIMGFLVYLGHHKEFVGLLKGREHKLRM